MKIKSVLAVLVTVFLGMFFVDNVDNNAYSQSPDRIVEQSCNRSSDCTGGRVCVSNWCAECGNDSDCSRSNTKFCLTNSQYPKLNRCVECTSDGQCGVEGMICKARDYTCTCTGGKILVSTKSFPKCSACAGTGTHRSCANQKNCPVGWLCAEWKPEPGGHIVAVEGGYCIADCRQPTRFDSGEFQRQVPFKQTLPKPGTEKGTIQTPEEIQIAPETQHIAPDDSIQKKGKPKP